MPNAIVVTDQSATPSSTAQSAHLPTSDRQARRAHAFFWRILIAAALISVVGNATHAVLRSPDHPGLAVAVAVVPPVALLAAVHGVAVLSRAHGSARVTRFLTITLTLLIAAGAFRLSYTALRSLALTAGISADEAWLWPLIIEGSMAQATAALLITTGNHRTYAETDPEQEENVESPAADAGSPAVRTTCTTPITAHTKPVHMGQQSDARPASHAPWPELAAAICARDSAGRRRIDEVTLILARHFDDGWNATQIADHVHRSRSTVSRILSDAIRLCPDIQTETATQPDKHALGAPIESTQSHPEDRGSNTTLVDELVSGQIDSA